MQEYQFSLEWPRYSALLNSMVGEFLLYEAVGAFLIDVTLIAVWQFGGCQLPRRLHLAVIWMLTATLSWAPRSR